MKRHSMPLVILLAFGLVGAVLTVVVLANRQSIQKRPTAGQVRKEVAKQVVPAIEEKVAPKVEQAQGTAESTRRELDAEQARNTELEARIAGAEGRIMTLEMEAERPRPMPEPLVVPSPVVVSSPVPAPSPSPSPEPSPSPTEPVLPTLPPLFPAPEPSPSPSACNVVHLDLIQRPALCL